MSDAPLPQTPDARKPGDFTSEVYVELRALAQRQLQNDPGHLLQPTALVHEAYLKIARLEEVRAKEPAQFFALAGHAMRSILVDHARQEHARKRGGGGARVELDSSIHAAVEHSVHDVLALNEALEQLAKVDPELVQIVDLMFFAGKTAAEAGAILGVSGRTVERGWRLARAWLRQALGGGFDGFGHAGGCQ